MAEEYMQQIAKRLDNMENEMREMRKAITQMARTEERVAVIIDQNGILFKRIDEMRAKINSIENENARQQKSIGFFEKAGWMVAGVVGSVIGAVASFFMKL